MSTAFYNFDVKKKKIKALHMTKFLLYGCSNEDGYCILFFKGDSVLKIQYLVDEKLKNRPEGPTVNELSELFYTNREDFKRRYVTSFF